MGDLGGLATPLSKGIATIGPPGGIALNLPEVQLCKVTVCIVQMINFQVQMHLGRRVPILCQGGDGSHGGTLVWELLVLGCLASRGLGASASGVGSSCALIHGRGFHQVWGSIQLHEWPSHFLPEAPQRPAQVSALHGG